MAMSLDLDERCGWEGVVLWEGCRPAAAAPIRTLVWEFPYSTGATLKRRKKKKGIGIVKHIGRPKDEWVERSMVRWLVGWLDGQGFELPTIRHVDERGIST